jgi:glyoxylase-like metal-dependent hydrolase (beta-lactamase superfamily II)
MDDVIVYIKSRKLLFSGDLIINKTNPVLNKESGANVERWIKILDLILKKDIKTIVPGHGNVGDKELASSLKRYFEDMTMAANDPSRASELKAKYKDWTKMPFFATPDKTISYIKSRD